MSKPDMEKYATYNELLGNSRRDNRPELFLHKLKEQVDERVKDEKEYKLEHIYFDKISPSMKNKVFATPDPNLNDESMHPEWNQYFVDLFVGLMKKLIDKKLDQLRQLLNGGDKEKKTLKKFVFLLMQKLVNNNDIRDGNIRNIIDSNVDSNSELAKAALDIQTKITNILQDGDLIVAETAKLTNSPLIFHIDMNKLVYKQMIKDAGEKPQSLSVAHDFFKVDVEEGKYARNSNGLLVDMSDPAHPEGIPVDHKSLMDNGKLKITDKCFGTGFVEQNRGQCAEYLRSCLKGRPDGIKNCKRFMLKEDYWERAKDEAANISPFMLTKTLDSFNFDMEDYVHPVTKQTLKRYKDVNEWLKKLNKLVESNSGGLTPEDFKNIGKNTKMHGYLGMLVKRANDNPIILNAEYSGQPKVPGANVTKPIGLQLQQYGILPYSRGVSALSGVARVHSSAVSQLPPYRLGYGSSLAIIPGGLSSMGVPILSGGATYKNIIESHTETTNNPSLQIWSVYESEYNQLVAKLDQYGKKIDSDDDKSIKALITQLRKSELALNKSILYAAKYAQLMEVYGQHDVNKVLNMPELEKFVDAREHYFKKVSERRNTLYNIIQAVAEATVKEAQNKNGQPAANNAQDVDLDSLKLKL